MQPTKQSSWLFDVNLVVKLSVLGQIWVLGEEQARREEKEVGGGEVRGITSILFLYSLKSNRV